MSQCLRVFELWGHSYQEIFIQTKTLRQDFNVISRYLCFSVNLGLLAFYFFLKTWENQYNDAEMSLCFTPFSLHMDYLSAHRNNKTSRMRTSSLCCVVILHVCTQRWLKVSQEAHYVDYMHFYWHTTNRNVTINLINLEHKNRIPEGCSRETHGKVHQAQQTRQPATQTQQLRFHRPNNYTI